MTSGVDIKILLNRLFLRYHFLECLLHRCRLSLSQNLLKHQIGQQAEAMWPIVVSEHQFNGEISFCVSGHNFYEK